MCVFVDLVPSPEAPKEVYFSLQSICNMCGYPDEVLNLSKRLHLEGKEVRQLKPSGLIIVPYNPISQVLENSDHMFPDVIALLSLAVKQCLLC